MQDKPLGCSLDVKPHLSQRRLFKDDEIVIHVDPCSAASSSTAATPLSPNTPQSLSSSQSARWTAAALSAALVAEHHLLNESGDNCGDEGLSDSGEEHSPINATAFELRLSNGIARLGRQLSILEDIMALAECDGPLQFNGNVGITDPNARGEPKRAHSSKSEN